MLIVLCVTLPVLLVVNCTILIENTIWDSLFNEVPKSLVLRVVSPAAENDNMKPSVVEHNIWFMSEPCMYGICFVLVLGY